MGTRPTAIKRGGVSPQMYPAMVTANVVVGFLLSKCYRNGYRLSFFRVSGVAIFWGVNGGAHWICMVCVLWCCLRFFI